MSEAVAPSPGVLPSPGEGARPITADDLDQLATAVANQGAMFMMASTSLADLAATGQQITTTIARARWWATLVGSTVSGIAAMALAAWALQGLI